MSSITVTNIKATGETNSREVAGVSAGFCSLNNVSPAINDSLNMSSVTDHQTGNYSCNWANNMDNVNYVIGQTGGSNSTAAPNVIFAHNTLPDVGAFKAISKNFSGANLDMHFVSIIMFGDLA